VGVESDCNAACEASDSSSRKYAACFVQGMSSKLHHAVEYPHLLDLKAVCEDSLKQLGETRFQLEGVLLHEGDGTEWGHYSGEYQTPDGAWQHISDADMSHSSLQSALSHQTEVYMAVYKRLSSRYKAISLGLVSVQACRQEQVLPCMPGTLCCHDAQQV